jgi:hypothetical protein
MAGTTISIGAHRPILLGCVFSALLIFVPGCGGNEATERESAESPVVWFTWLSNTTWLIQAGDITILADAAVSRINVAPPDIERPETFYPDLVSPDVALIEKIFAANSVQRVSYILVGHGHIDHVIDLGPMARIGESEIIGSRTVCHQAVALGIPTERCRPVEGGEVLSLGPKLQVRVIRWEHSGDPATPLGRLIESPKELLGPPRFDPISGAIGPSPFTGTPNGGGARAYLFSYDRGGEKLRWLVSDTGNSETFDGVPVTDESFFEDLGLSLENLELVAAQGTPREWLTEALADEGTNEVYVWLAYGSEPHVRQVTEHLKPVALVPHHWGGFMAPYAAGVVGPPRRPALEAYLEEIGIAYMPQSQYLEHYRLTPEGLERVSSVEVQRELGLPTTEP